MAKRRLILVARSWGIYLCRGLWKILKWTWGAIFAGGGLGLISSWLVMPFGSIFSNTPIGVIYEHLDITLKVISGYALFTIIIWLVSLQNPSPTSPTSPTSSTLTPTQTDRHALVHLLRQEYRKRLAQSLQVKAMIALNLHEHIDATRSSAQLVFHRIDRAHEIPLPSGIPIIQAYDDAGQRLLLLGAPGAGKTTFLLDLARELLIRAEVNHTHSIPVILNLSSWASKKAPLAIWLIEQLSLIYGVPSILSQALLKRDQWLLLLDGLDEVETTARDACIEAINIYRREHLVPLVICSRSHEYLTQEARLNLPSAIVIQPLQYKQIIEYLEQLGKPMELVRIALGKNASFQQLLTTPLMLSIVIATYRDVTTEDLLQRGSEDLQRLILEHYAQQMLRHSTAKKRVSSQQALLWLIWLARQMQQRHLTEFYLEWLQFSWLPMKWSQALHRIHLALIVGFYFGLRAGLFLGLIAGLIFGIGSGAVIGLLSGLIVALISGLLDALPKTSLNVYLHTKFHQGIWSSRRKALRFLLVISVSFGLLVAPIDGLVVGLRLGLLFGIGSGVVIGLLSGLIVALIFGSVWCLVVDLVSKLLFTLSTLQSEIYHQEVIKWSWRDECWLGLVVAPVVALVGVAVNGSAWAGAVGLLTSFAIVLARGLSSEQISEEKRVVPNEGIQNAGRNALRVGVVIALPLVLAIGLLGNRYVGLTVSLIIGLLTALIAGVYLALRLGGKDYLEHYYLRYLLRCTGAMPWRYVRFLEEMGGCILLERVGAGYRFIHPLFQEYFASLPTGAPSSPPPQPPSSQP